MKRKTAKEILAESFQELAASKTIDKITVKDIADNCGYSTATFYRQFRDKYDLIAWQYSQTVAEIMVPVETNEHGWKQTVLDGARNFDANREYLANLLLHTNGYDSFLSYMTEIHYNALKRCILKSSGREDLDMQMQMYTRLYCMGTVCLTSEWILGKYTATPEEIAEIYENSLPAPLQPYIMRK